MADEKKCKFCGAGNSQKWIERKNIVGHKAYFCSPKCYQDYKKKGAETGTCEFC
jgi:YHS domain-containing protein